MSSRLSSWNKRKKNTINFAKIFMNKSLGNQDRGFKGLSHQDIFENLRVLDILFSSADH